MDCLSDEDREAHLEQWREEGFEQKKSSRSTEPPEDGRSHEVFSRDMRVSRKLRLEFQ